MLSLCPGNPVSEKQALPPATAGLLGACISQGFPEKQNQQDICTLCTVYEETCFKELAHMIVGGSKFKVSV